MENIYFNEGCVLERGNLRPIGIGKGKKEKLFGKFIDECEKFFVFKTTSGYKECFTKKSYGIDWRVLKQ